MLFTAVDPAGLITLLTAEINTCAGRTVIGIDGDDAVGTPELAAAVVESLRETGREAHLVSTSWWWRPAALRLENGREDVDSLLTHWVDEPAITREILRPFASGGTGSFLPRLRDPVADRSVRAARILAGPGAVLLLHGSLLSAGTLRPGARIVLRVGRSTLVRRLPADRQWWADAFGRYEQENRPEDGAFAVVAYDHPRSPAISMAGLMAAGAGEPDASACHSKQ